MSLPEWCTSGFCYQIVRCDLCGDDVHVEPGESDRAALCVECSIDPARVPAAKNRPTSVAAAARIEPAVGGLEKRVLQAIVDSPAGLTDEQLQQRLHLKGNTQRPRRVRLLELGLVRDSGERRETESGGSAVVWISTGKAAA